MIKSKSQQRLMYAVMNSPKVAKKLNIKKNIAKEFIKSTPKKSYSNLKESVSKLKKRMLRK